MNLLQYVLRRLAWSIPTVLGTLVVIFFLMMISFTYAQFRLSRHWVHYEAEVK